MKKFLLPLILLVPIRSFSQSAYTLAQRAWADSVFSSLTDDQRIAQLMVLRLSERTPKGTVFYDKEVEENIKKYNIGSICLFQGSPVRQAELINHFQSIAQTPIMVCMDAETGVGMRFTDSVAKFPDQLTIGAMPDADLVYKVGNAIGEQCKRMGIHVNYAPVVDINNNPNNPIINFRSFGENKYKVALFGVRMMKGIQDMNVMACAKHFPGHGDVSVDSHKDLPIINKTRLQLDSLELYPFREMFKAGVGSVMVAHLYIPAIDSTPNRATSISYNNVTKLMREELGFKGLSFTDALEMQGIKKFFPDGQAAVESLMAGNDMLCLPGNIDTCIVKIKEAIADNCFTWDQLYDKVKKVLQAKYRYVINNAGQINTTNLTKDLNEKVPSLRKMVAENAITLLRNEDSLSLSLAAWQNKKIAYVGIGLFEDNTFSHRIREDYKADIFYFDYQKTSKEIDSLINKLKNYDLVITSIHNYTKYPVNNFGFSWASMQLLKQIQQETKSVSLFFGNPYALKNSCNARNVFACYEDDDIFQNTAADILEGVIPAKGLLPVTVCESFKFGAGIINNRVMPSVDPLAAGLKDSVLIKIDSVVGKALEMGATPGCVVLVARNGKIAYEKAFGYYTGEKREKVQTESIYDLASVTKVFATTLAIMKLYDEGKIDLKKNLGDYLNWVKGTNKQSLLIEDVLLHQAGLVAFVPFYKETVDASNGLANYAIYTTKLLPGHSIKVAEDIYMRDDWKDTLYNRILKSPLGPRGKYVYSDLDFIFLGKIVEALTGKPLDKYVKEEFYDKLNLMTTGFKPRERFPLNEIVPTEREYGFRAQLLRGDVHDPGAAMFGEVAGHAGLFSDAYDLAILSQMLLNGGSFAGQQFIKKSTIDLFTAYHSDTSRRGYGFDKPEKDNAELEEPYPCASASPLTYGHLGFTGTCFWVDPAYNLIYIFLSNRVNSYGGNKLAKMNIRGKIQEIIYNSLDND